MQAAAARPASDSAAPPIHTQVRHFTSEGERLKSNNLALLSQKLIADPFAKVKVFIESMISRLFEEANADSVHEGRCDTKLGRSQSACTKLGEDIDTLMPEKTDSVKLKTNELAKTVGKLVETRDSQGPFTVFASTNEAFEKIPKDKLNQLFGNKVLLDNSLEYHVLSGSFKIRDGMSAKLINTLENDAVVIRSMHKAVMANNANVVTSDAFVTNGYIQVIDHVLVPPNFAIAFYPDNVVELAESQPDSLPPQEMQQLKQPEPQQVSLQPHKLKPEQPERA